LGAEGRGMSLLGSLVFGSPLFGSLFDRPMGGCQFSGHYARALQVGIGEEVLAFPHRDDQAFRYASESLDQRRADASRCRHVPPSSSAGSHFKGLLCSSCFHWLLRRGPASVFMISARTLFLFKFSHISASHHRRLGRDDCLLPSPFNQPLLHL